MRLMVAAVGIAALTLLMTQAAAQTGSADHPSCNPFSAQVAGARGNRAALEALSKTTPGHCTRTQTAIQAAMPAPASLPPPLPVVSTPLSPPVAPPKRVSSPAPPRNAEADFFASADTCVKMRDYQRRYPNGRYRDQAQAFVNSETCTLQPSPPVAPPTRVSLPPPPPVASFTPGPTFRDCAECPEMVAIPAGNFVMGSPAVEADRGTDEGPQRTVSIRAFAAGKFEVTFDEWAACTAGGGCRSNPNPSDQGWGRGRRPVIKVSWNDAQEYVQWLSSKTKQHYRLLTEAEWEYAALGGTTGRFSNDGGEKELCQIANGADQSTSYFLKNKACNDGVGEETALVGRYAANPFGLYDVHGNVWEWVQDCYDNSYAGAPTDGSAVKPGAECASSRVVRGGSWGSVPRLLRSAFRFWYYPSGRRIGIGFRLARSEPSN
jgi:formylglycine-generating enzyme required for sulfatase activity